jgi:hypothetical protein
MATKEKTTTAEQVQEAEKTAEAETTPTVTAPAKVASVQAESVYTAEELSGSASKLFNVRAECVAAALKVAGIKECTVSKAKETVEAFMKKEVK